MAVGNIYLVERERITLLETGTKDIVNCISQWGMGSKKIIADTRERAMSKSES